MDIQVQMDYFVKNKDLSFQLETTVIEYYTNSLNTRAFYNHSLALAKAFCWQVKRVRADEF